MSRKENEEKLTKFWKSNKTFEKSVEKNPKSNTYVFYDGPPFATGLPHYGHIQGLTCKDLFPRFWTMKGKRCERRWGWDCHGLPIENIAEKELGIKKKNEIESHGIKQFNEFCRSKVLFFADEWKKTVDRIGIWTDFDNSYKTMDNTYMESVWHIFKTLHQKGYIYKGKKVLMYCPRCETPLAKAEIAMDNSYKDVTEKTATVKFKLKEQENTFLLAWTTTPWTLIGNTAIAINPELNYVKIKQNNQFLILAKDRLKDALEEKEYELVEEFKGEKILNLEYEPLYHVQTKELDKKAHYVINGGTEVSADEGTGLVHMAIYGEFDYEMIKKHNMPHIQHISNQGKLQMGPEQWHGLWFKKLDKHVIEDLEERNLLFKAKSHTHPYPFCYRCETPLLYNAVDSWFVNIQKIKPQLLKRNEDDINWHPEHLKHGRFKNIIETAPDWSISRNRFWATTIPVWECDNKSCTHQEIIGSVAELKDKATTIVDDYLDLHKHVVDHIKIKCEKCSSEMTRIPEVLDCWFESGSMPYAAKHYPFENKEWFANNFPCDFVAEYVGQVRAWFYYMHVIGVLLYDKAPFKNIKATGIALAEDGAKMSKSKKNFPDPKIILDQYGADALRFYLMSSNLMKGQDLNFKEDHLKDVYRKVIVILSNVNRFYNMFTKDNPLYEFKSQNILDKWVNSRLNQLIKETNDALERYDPITACNSILHFVDELSTWYVRRSRDRFKSDNENEKLEAVSTLGHVLYNLSKVIAPIMPFISEDIYQTFAKLTNIESVHLDNWPTFDETQINLELETNMNLARDIVSKALDQREQSQIPIRQVLSKLTINGIEFVEGIKQIIAQEVNVKEVQCIKADEISVGLNIELTPELIEEGMSRDLIRKLNNARKKQSLTIENKIILTIETNDEEIKNMVEKFQDEIKKSIQANEIKFDVANQELKIKNFVLKVKLEKI